MIGWRFYDYGPSPLRDALEQLAADPRRRHGGAEPVPINVYEEGGEVVVEAMMPGVRPEDVEVSCSDNLLTIRGRSGFGDHEYIHQELHGSEFLRQIALPADYRFDRAEASSEHGLLTVRVPKVRPRAPEKIRIQVNRRGGPAAPRVEARPTTIEAEPGTGYSEVKPRGRRRHAGAPPDDGG